MTDTPTRWQANQELARLLAGSILMHSGRGIDLVATTAVVRDLAKALALHPEYLPALGIMADREKIEREVRAAIAAGVLASVANTTDARKRTIVTGVVRQIDAQARPAQPETGATAWRP